MVFLQSHKFSKIQDVFCHFAIGSPEIEHTTKIISYRESEFSALHISSIVTWFQINLTALHNFVSWILLLRSKDADLKLVKKQTKKNSASTQDCSDYEHNPLKNDKCLRNVNVTIVAHQRLFI